MAYQSEIEKLEARFREKPEQWFAALADQYRKAGDAKMALELLNAWIDRRPNYTSGYIVLGRCLLDQERLGDAAEAFENVLRLDMENVIALQSLSEIAERRGDLDGARTWLERLLDADPMNDEARDALQHLGKEPVESAEAAEIAEAVETPEPAEANEVSKVAEGGETPDVDSVDEPAGATVADESPAALDIERSSDAFETLEPGSDQAEPRVSLPDVSEAEAWQPWDSVESQASEDQEAPEQTGVPEPEGAPEGAELPDLQAGEQETAEPGVAEVSSAASEPVAGFEPAGFEPPEEPGVVPVDGLEPEHVAAEPAEEPPIVEGLEPEHVVAEPADEPSAVEGLEQREFEAPTEEPEPLEGVEPTPFESALTESGPDSALADESVRDEPAEALPGETTAQSQAAAEETAVPAGISPEPPPDGQPKSEAPIADEPMVAAGDVPPEDGPAAESEEDGAAAGGEPEEVAVADASDEDDHRELPIILPEEVATELDEPGIREPEPVVTETMAELYVAQGLYAEARDIYGKLLDQNPGNERIRNRLAEVVEQAAGAKAETAPSRRDRYAASATKNLSVGELMRQLAAGKEPASTADPAAPAAEAGKGTGSAFSFENYFGEAGQGPTEPDTPPPVPERPEGASEAERGQDEDFRDWLKGLKT
jgi:tetratricopeptide (TPR) repeat protein